MFTFESDIILFLHSFFLYLFRTKHTCTASFAGFTAAKNCTCVSRRYVLNSNLLFQKKIYLQNQCLLTKKS